MKWNFNFYSKQFNLSEILKNLYADTIQPLREKKVPSDMCANEDSDHCASAQSDQSLRCPHEDILRPWLSKLQPVKNMIRLHECAG